MEELAGVDRTFVGLPSPCGIARMPAGGHPCQGIYYTPAGRAPTVALVATHYNIDFSEHYLAARFARRGFGFLGWNTRFRGAEATFLADHAVAEIGAGVRWLRDQGVEVVVLLGNSGGGSLMAAYQSQSVAAPLVPTPGLKLSRGLDDLVPGDLYVSLAAHPGRADLITGSMDPSVLDEADPASVDPGLDMYDEANGPPYDQAFQQRYRAAQVERNRRITAWVHGELDRLAASGTPATDRLFTVSRLWADLRYLDPAIDPSSRPVGRCWLGDPRRANYGVFGIGQVNTLRTWLSMWSLDDSQCRAEQHLPNVGVPALVIDADADTGIYPSDTDAIVGLLGGDDVTRLTVAGDHYFVEPVGARDEVADAIGAWISERT